MDKSLGEIGDRIRLARVRKAYTQRALGTMMGVSFQMIQSYEHGHKLTVERLLLLASCLAVDPNWLLTGGHNKVRTLKLHRGVAPGLLLEQSYHRVRDEFAGVGAVQEAYPDSVRCWLCGHHPGKCQCYGRCRFCGRMHPRGGACTNPTCEA